LISSKSEIKWYNDITTTDVSGLFAILLKIKDTLGEKTSGASTHITEGLLGSGSLIELHTLNSKNSPPKLISRKDMLEILSKEWLKLL
jgi:hypothetical protein